MQRKWESMRCPIESSPNENPRAVSVHHNICLLSSLLMVSFRSRPSGTSIQDSPSSGDQRFSLDLPALPSPDVQGNISELHDHHKQFFDVDDSDCPVSRAAQEKSSPAQGAQPLIQQRKVTLNQAEKLLTAFKKKAHFFPFVQISDEATVPSLSRTTPFLLLAMLSAASMSDPQLNYQIDYEFRRVLSLKVVVEGRKSLEYLQGLLVYIAW